MHEIVWDSVSESSNNRVRFVGRRTSFVSLVVSLLDSVLFRQFFFFLVLRTVVRHCLCGCVCNRMSDRWWNKQNLTHAKLLDSMGFFFLRVVFMFSYLFPLPTILKYKNHDVILCVLTLTTRILTFTYFTFSIIILSYDVFFNNDHHIYLTVFIGFQQ